MTLLANAKELPETALCFFLLRDHSYAPCSLRAQSLLSLG